MTISSIFNACYSGSVIDTPEEETLLDSVVEPFLAGDTGPALPPKIADFIARMITEKLSDDKLNEKVRAYKQPENCDILQPTRINQIIWDKIKPGTRSKDIKVQKRSQYWSNGCHYQRFFGRSGLKKRFMDSSTPWRYWHKVIYSSTLLGES